MSGQQPLLQFRVAGLPRTQGSHRPQLTNHKDPAQRRAILRQQNSAAHKHWREAVEKAARQACADAVHESPLLAFPLSGPLRYVMLFGLYRGKAPKYPTPIGKNSGDVSKLARAVEDACTAAGVWVDDCLVVDGRTVKGYPDQVGLMEPGVLVRIYRADAAPPVTGPILLPLNEIGDKP